MAIDYSVKAKIAGDEHDLYVRSRIEAILENMDVSGGGGGSGTDPSSGSNVIYKELTSDELAAMWES